MLVLVDREGYYATDSFRVRAPTVARRPAARQRETVGPVLFYDISGHSTGGRLGVKG